MADSQKKSAQLFDKDNANTLNAYPSGGVIATVNTGKSIYIPCEANTTYTVSKMVTARFAVYLTDTTPSIGAAYTTVQYNNEGTKITITTGENTQYLCAFIFNSAIDTVTFDQVLETVMINKGSQPLPYEPYSATGWQHSLRKLTTATEAVENPLYSDGTAITAYTLKGNTVQSGTPTPSNPITISGVGNKTANLFNKNATNTANGYVADSRLNGSTVESNNSCDVSEYIAIDAATTYTMSGFFAGWSSSLVYYDMSKNIISYLLYENKRVITFTTPANAAYIRITISKPDIDTTMLNDGIEALPYEGYGYKIPISSNGVSYPIYLSEPIRKIETAVDSMASTGTATRAIKQIVLNGTENWVYDSTYTRFTVEIPYFKVDGVRATPFYMSHFQVVSDGRDIANVPDNAAYSGDVTGRLYVKTSMYTSETDFKSWLSSNPVTMIFVSTTATTETFTAPSIPTTEGANSITVDTTVQPSEFTATWTGWHNATVKEKSENIYDKYNVIQVANLGTRYGSYVDKGIYSIYNDTDNDVYWGGNGFQSRYLACSPHSTATIDMSTFSYSDYGFIMPYNDASLGDVSIVQGSTVPDHYIPYWK